MVASLPSHAGIKAHFIYSARPGWKYPLLRLVSRGGERAMHEKGTKSSMAVAYVSAPACDSESASLLHWPQPADRRAWRLSAVQPPPLAPQQTGKTFEDICVQGQVVMYLLRYSRNQSIWEGNRSVVTRVVILTPGNGKGCRGWTHGPSYIVL